MSDLNSLLRDYAIESGELVIPEVISSGDALAEVMNDELEIAREPGLAEKLEHADKAEAIAEQLDVLADRAEAQAAVDQTEVSAAVAQVSAESMHREFATIMGANGLELKAASFESATDVAGQLAGLSKDARMTASVVRNFAGDIRDLSTEGAIMQFLRQDKARLIKAHSALSAAAGELNTKKGELSKEPVIVHHDGLKKFLIVSGQPVTNVKTAIDHDIQWLKKAEAQVNKLAAEIGAALGSAHGEGDHSAVLTKLNAIAGEAGTGLEAHLLGNHEVSAAKRSGGEKIEGKTAAISYVVGGFKAIPSSILIAIGGTVGMMAGAAVAGAAGVVAASVAHTAAQYANTGKKVMKEYDKRTQSTEAKSICGANDLVAIAKDLGTLSSATNFSMDGSVEAAGEKLEGAPADVKAAGKRALSAVSKLADTVYEHAVYLTVKTAQLVSSTAAKA